MAEALNIIAEERKLKGKSNSRTLRSQNLIPAVIYGAKDEAKKIQILEKDLVKATQFSGFSSQVINCLLYTSPSPRDGLLSRMPSSA